MEELSYKSLSILFAIAMVISLTGIFWALKGTNLIEYGITGYQTASGTSRVNVTETISITLNQSTVDFGAGYRDPGQIDNGRLCNLTSGSGLPSSPACWLNTSVYSPQDLALENTGTSDVNVTINSSLAATFINQNGGTYMNSIWPNYTWTGQHYTADDGCTGATNLTDTQTDFTNAEQTLCNQFMAATANDMLNVSVVVRLPAGPTGNFTTSIRFTARKFLGS
jgi:hypothetical protein